MGMGRKSQERGRRRSCSMLSVGFVKNSERFCIEREMEMERQGR